MNSKLNSLSFTDEYSYNSQANEWRHAYAKRYVFCSNKNCRWGNSNY